METSKRIRLIFKDDDILSEAQKFDGLNRCLLLLKPRQHDTVQAIASHLLHAFQLHESCPNGLLLSISGYVLPPFESTQILKDNEVIRVQKKRDVLAIEGNNAANEVQKLKAVEKQPVKGGILLLANEEFEKEKGGYESDEPEEESEGTDKEDPSDSKNWKRKRKRKAEEKLQGSKNKKQCSEASRSVANDVHGEDIGKDGGRKKKKRRHNNEKKDDDSSAEEYVENDEETLKLSDKKKKTRGSKEKKDDSNAEDNVENDEEADKLSDKSPVPDMKQNDEVEENGKETEDAKIDPVATKKGPSRSTRRKYAKRRWMKEMAKIQKQNATCESEGLRNWKEDKCKAERKKVDGPSKGPKWKKNQMDADKIEDDGQPKGLLHWKLTPQNDRPFKDKRRQQKYQNVYFQKHLNHSGDVHELSTQNGHGLEQTNQNQGDLHQQPGQKSAQEHQKQNRDASDQVNQESEKENDVVPVVIRPGYIRFEPLGKEEHVQQNHLPSDNFQWVGTISKKKGQQWGKENRSFTSRNDDNNFNKENSDILSSEKEKPPPKEIDFDKLPPLPSIPKEGDLIAYRVLELSSSWTPELSPYRVGKVSYYNAESNQTLLDPVPEYPIVSEKVDEDEAAQPDNSLYKEDGSLEIDFSTLLEVRIINKERSEPGNEALSCVTENCLGNGNAPQTVIPGSNDKEMVVPSADTAELEEGKETQQPTAETGGRSIWEQVSEALSAKKEELSKDNGWGKTPPKKVQPSAGSCWAEKVQPSQQNSWGKQNSGGKSWSHKALRGKSALGPTMAILRSKRDIW